MQVKPSTAGELGSWALEALNSDVLLDHLYVGCAYLARLRDHYGFLSEFGMIRAYNAGPGAARRVWRTRKVEDALEAADPRERGTQVHAAAAAAFQAAWDAGGRTNVRKALEAARDAAMKAVGADAEATPLRRELLMGSVEVAMGFVAHGLREVGFSFAFAEQPFGPRVGGVWDALRLERPADGDDGRGAMISGAEGPIFVEGKIDRIDKADGKNAARVVDYKTGQVPRQTEQGSLHLQLPLYSAVVARATGVDEVQALYLGADKRGAIKASPAREGDRKAVADKREEAAKNARRVILQLLASVTVTV